MALLKAASTIGTGGSSTSVDEVLGDEQGKERVLTDGGKLCPWRRDFKNASDDCISWSQFVIIDPSADCSAERDACAD